MANHPRVDDLLEVMRRWEDVRLSGWLTDGQKQEIIQNYAKAALLNFRKAQVQLAQTQIKSPALYAEYEQARLAWRIAFFRHQYNRNAYPATPDKKEMTFLTDLISLQGK